MKSEREANSWPELLGDGSRSWQMESALFPEFTSCSTEPASEQADFGRSGTEGRGLQLRSRKLVNAVSNVGYLIAAAEAVEYVGQGGEGSSQFTSEYLRLPLHEVSIDNDGFLGGGQCLR